MLCFPQLSTGSIGQYPIQKRRLSRAVVNEASDGSRVKLADPGAGAIEWTLTFESLSDEERSALKNLHSVTEGRLGSFTFLDPTDNLLCWSEKLDDSVWERNALLTVTPNVTDPAGGTHANRLTNTGGAPLAIEQTVNGPGWFRYAFGLQARSDQEQQISLIRSTATQTHRASFRIGPEWTRIVLSGNFTGVEESVDFGIELSPGHAVELYGVQAEAQAGASGYKKTFSSCGVYSEARFMDDDISLTADGPNQHSCKLGIRTRG
jgi:hypothetical protein